ncbi:MAG: hypothetical protein R2728_09225 [Chitinophagales bacterium]
MKRTITISTYQAGKIVFVSPNGPEKLVQLPRTFKKAMGIAYKKGKIIGLHFKMK